MPVRIMRHRESDTEERYGRKIRKRDTGETYRKVCRSMFEDISRQAFFFAVFCSGPEIPLDKERNTSYILDVKYLAKLI